MTITDDSSAPATARDPRDTITMCGVLLARCEPCAGWHEPGDHTEGLCWCGLPVRLHEIGLARARRARLAVRS